MSISQATQPTALAGFVHNSLQPDLQAPPPAPPAHTTTNTTQSDRSLTTTTNHANGTHTTRVATAPRPASTLLDHTNGAQLGTLLSAQEQTTPTQVTFAKSPYATTK